MGGSMKTLKSIIIIHDIIYRMDFAYLAELFRYLGIFVCEDILVEMDEEQILERYNSTDYDAYIFVGNKKITDKEEKLLGCRIEEYAGLIGKLPEKTVYFSDCWNNCGLGRSLSTSGFPEPAHICLDEKQQTVLLLDVIHRVLEQVDGKGIDADISELLSGLVEVYTQNNLMFHSMNLQYYSKLPSIAVKDAKEAFIQAYTQILGCKKQGIDDKVAMHYKYALLWCAMKANNACDYQRDILYFPLVELVEQCKGLCEEYKDFTNAKILLGLCYEPSSGSGNEALMVFRDVLQEMGNVCFTSPVYYWMGKRFESFNGKEKDAEACYINANERKEKFRNYYKLAIFERDRKGYDKSLELFDKILDKLEWKLENDFADSLELEYAFKVCTQKCFIYYHMKNYAATIEMGNKVIEIINDKIDNSKFFEMFYGDKAPDYKEILRKRLSLKTVYQLLMEAYSDLMNKEKVKEYKQKLIEMKVG